MSKNTAEPMTLERAKEISHEYIVSKIREMLNHPIFKDDADSIQEEVVKAAEELGIPHEEALTFTDFLVDEAQKNQV